jgi:hypothetical protein
MQNEFLIIQISVGVHLLALDPLKLLLDVLAIVPGMHGPRKGPRLLLDRLFSYFI